MPVRDLIKHERRTMLARPHGTTLDPLNIRICQFSNPGRPTGCFSVERRMSTTRPCTGGERRDCPTWSLKEF